MHPSLAGMLRGFSYAHLPEGSDVRTVSKKCSELKDWMLVALPQTPELVAGLRKLLEAKDCFVRQAAFSAADLKATADAYEEASK